MAGNPEEALGPEHCRQGTLFKHLDPQSVGVKSSVCPVHKAGDAVLLGLRDMSLSQQLLGPASCQRCPLNVEPAVAIQSVDLSRFEVVSQRPMRV